MTVHDYQGYKKLSVVWDLIWVNCVESTTHQQMHPKRWTVRFLMQALSPRFAITFNDASGEQCSKSSQHSNRTFQRKGFKHSFSKQNMQFWWLLWTFYQMHQTSVVLTLLGLFHRTRSWNLKCPCTIQPVIFMGMKFSVCSLHRMLSQTYPKDITQRAVTKIHTEGLPKCKRQEIIFWFCSTVLVQATMLHPQILQGHQTQSWYSVV